MTVPQGLITAIVTPLGEDGKLDAAGLEKLIERVIRGSDCIFVSSVYAGEGLNLPGEARRELVRVAAEIVGARKKLMVGVTGSSPEDTASNIRFAENELSRLGYAGTAYLVDAPLCYRGNRGLRAHYVELAGMCSLPFILSNQPAAVESTKVRFRRHNIMTGVLKKLSYNSRIVGIEHNGTHDRALNYMKALRHRQDFGFYDANELNFLDYPSAGGIVSPGANLLPGDWRLIVDSSYGADEKLKEEESYRRRILEIRRKLQELYDCYRLSPAGLLKHALKSAGVLKSDFFCGGAPAGDEARRRMRLFFERWESE